MKRIIPTVLLSLIAVLSAAAQSLPATVIMRAAGPVEDSNRYKAGYISVGKSMAGQSKEINWKGFVVFDVVSAVEELAQNPDAKVRIALDWIKSPDDVRDLHIYYVGSMPTANFVDRDMWSIFPTSKGVKLGTLESYNLAALKQRDWIEISLKGKVPSGEVTPVNRYMVFRLESDALTNPAGNGLIGLSPQLAQHTLIIGGASQGSSANTGGY